MAMVGPWIGLALTLLIVGVACVAMSLNHQLKRMDAEKKAKVATFLLRKTLLGVFVQADAGVGRVVYELWGSCDASAEEARRTVSYCEHRAKPHLGIRFVRPRC